MPTLRLTCDELPNKVAVFQFNDEELREEDNKTLRVKLQIAIESLKELLQVKEK